MILILHFILCAFRKKGEKMGINKKISLAVSIFALFFGFQAFGQSIQYVSMTNQISEAKIDEKNHTIFVEFPYFKKDVSRELSDISKISEESVFDLSDATLSAILFDLDCSAALPESFDMVHGTSLTVKTPNGDEEWKIYGGYQLPESDFSAWHTERLPGFLTFGSKECSEMPGTSPLCWDNGNPAFSASGSTKWPTAQVTLNDGTTAAKLVTRKVIGVIASGNLFTGRIVRTMGLKQLLGFTSKDGKQLIEWGIPFEARPKGFRVKFSYEGLGDECSLYATLENHTTDKNGKTQRNYVATAAYTGIIDFENKTTCTTRVSDKDSNGLRTLEVDFLYGAYPENASPMPEGVAQVGADEKITHVNVVFASSAHGDYFKGVKNATLIVKDFEFVY